MHISTFPDSIICPACQLSQFERGSGKCRRCHKSLGINYMDIFVPKPFDCLDSQSRAALRIELGALMRKLRCRCGITQAALASVTGIHRTYLSRAEHGQVVPSTIALIRIAGALGVDKIMLRARAS